MLKKIIHILTVFFFLSGMLLASPATPARAATLTVNTLTDENDGSCLDSDCSLRDAIAVANDNDTITFSVTGTITLTAALTVAKNLTVTGPGSAQLTLDGNNQYQIFILSDEFPTNTINISGMTMTKGYADPLNVCGGGAIRSWAFLTMNDVVITNNHAPSNVGTCEYPRGGGILFFDGVGSLTLNNSTVSNNSTAYGGGGIHFSSYTGNISLNNVIIDNNQSAEDGGGVEITNALSTVTITNSTFSNNAAPGGSGAEGGGLQISTSGTTPTVTIQDSIFSANTAQDGGGIYAYGAAVNITNSTIADNSASNDGGGLFNYNGTITIISSTLEGNAVTGGSFSYGGGIYNLGNADTSSITIVNSTLAGNSSTNGQGGAIYNQASGGTVNDIAIINIYNSTIVGNSAKNSVGGGGILASTAGGAEVSTINLFNSIVYGNTLSTGSSGENCAINNDATIVKNNYNLFQNLANDCFPGVNDVTSALTTSAVVSALASNGGTTQTMSLPSGSPAINAGSNAICVTDPVNNQSQNGLSRPQGATCDIGAFEKDSSSTFKSSAANDGWILESSETSNTGGSMNGSATNLILGDDAADKQYRAILHFDTSALPDTAVVTTMTLKIKQQGNVIGTNPFSFGSLYVDMRNPAFDGNALELADFNFAAKKVKSAVFNPNPVSGWFSARFNNGGKLYINRTGVSQLRLYFSVDDNNNNIADFIRFFSGNAASGDRPKLLIQYYVP